MIYDPQKKNHNRPKKYFPEYLHILNIVIFSQLDNYYVFFLKTTKQDNYYVKTEISEICTIPVTLILFYFPRPFKSGAVED